MKKNRPCKESQFGPNENRDIKKSILPTNTDASMITGDIHPEEVIERIYQHAEYVPNDLTRLHHCLAVFYPKENQIFKVSGIDYRGNRFDVSGKITRWLRFPDAELFIFTNKEEFKHYYDLYYKARTEEGGERIKTAEEMFTWLARDANRLVLPHLAELKFKKGNKYVYKVYEINWVKDMKKSYHRDKLSAEQELAKFWLENKDKNYVTSPAKPQLVDVDEELFYRVQIENVYQ